MFRQPPPQKHAPKPVINLGPKPGSSSTNTNVITKGHVKAQINMFSDLQKSSSTNNPEPLSLRIIPRSATTNNIKIKTINLGNKAMKNKVLLNPNSKIKYESSSDPSMLKKKKYKNLTPIEKQKLHANARTAKATKKNKARNKAQNKQIGSYNTTAAQTAAASIPSPKSSSTNTATNRTLISEHEKKKALLEQLTKQKPPETTIPTPKQTQLPSTPNHDKNKADYEKYKREADITGLHFNNSFEKFSANRAKIDKNIAEKQKQFNSNNRKLKNNTESEGLTKFFNNTLKSEEASNPSTITGNAKIKSNEKTTAKNNATKKKEEEAAAATKKEEEDAAATKKKEEAEAAAATKKEEEAAATTKKKEEAEAAAAAAAASASKENIEKVNNIANVFNSKNSSIEAKITSVNDLNIVLRDSIGRNKDGNTNNVLRTLNIELTQMKKQMMQQQQEYATQLAQAKAQGLPAPAPIAKTPDYSGFFGRLREAFAKLGARYNNSNTRSKKVANIYKNFKVNKRARKTRRLANTPKSINKVNLETQANAEAKAQAENYRIETRGSLGGTMRSTITSSGTSSGT
jgi:hypothetical protein